MQRTAVILCMVFVFMHGSASWSGANTLSGLVMLSVEQLMEIEVTSAGRKTQKLEDTAAAKPVAVSDVPLADGQTRPERRALLCG